MLSISNSSILGKLGMSDFDLGYLVIGMAAVILILLIVIIVLICSMKRINKLQSRLDKFLIGKNGKSLEKEIMSLFEDNKFLKSSTEKNKKDIRTLFKNMESAYQKMGLVKYDAFQQMDS